MGQAEGKTLRASRSGQYPALHLLALYSERLKRVIAQLPVPPDQNEITVALGLLKEVSLEGVLLSGDAILTQKDTCQQVTEGGGGYVLPTSARLWNTTPITASNSST